MGTTPVALEAPGRQEKQRLMMLVRGYMDAQVVGAAARLGLADHLAAGPRGLDDLCQAMGADREALARFLGACEAVGLVEHRSAAYAITALGALLHLGWVRDMATAFTSPAFYSPWARLDQAVRSGQPQMQEAIGVELWEHFRGSPEHREAYTRWSDQAPDAVRLIVESGHLERFQRMVDVGGGQGAVLAELLEAVPAAHGVLFDLPEVIEGAAPALAERGLSRRVTLVAGSFLEHVPAGGDVYLLKHILSDWDDEHAAIILGHCHRAASPGTPLLVFDWTLPDDPGSHLHVTDVGLLLFSGGRIRSRAALTALVERAGFHVERAESTESEGLARVPWTVLEARRA